MRRTFLSTGTPQTEDKRWYVLQNWRMDPVVTLDDAGVQVERAHFSPYGRVFGMPAGDVNFDGVVGNTDTNLISAWGSLGYPYRAYADVNLDGNVDGADASAANTTTMGWDVLSDVGSTIGYAGYVQDDFIPTLSHVRHRVYKSDLGRWIQRDPAGYVDGGSLYEYVMSQPVGMRDPSGLLTSYDLLKWYWTKRGATMVLTGQDLTDYRSCPQVSRTTNAIIADVEKDALQAATHLFNQITCVCGEEPRRLSLLMSKTGSRTTGRGGQKGSACWAIGDHHIKYAATCYVFAACKDYPDPGDPPGATAYGYTCVVSFEGRDRFTDPLDLAQAARTCGIKGLGSALCYAQDRLLKGTSFDIRARWGEHVAKVMQGQRPYLPPWIGED